MQILHLLVIYCISANAWFGKEKGCTRGRDCNAPTAYSTISLTADTTSSTEPTYVTQANYNPQWLAKTKEGVDIVRTFLGSASDTLITSMVGGGTDADYATVVQECKTFISKYGSDISTHACSNVVSQAKQNTGSFYLSGFEDCICQRHTYIAAPIFMIPRSNDPNLMASEFVARAIHEYTHVVQKALGSPVPAWTMEGGAVLNECLFSNRLDNPETFSDCLTTGGGRGGVVKNLRKLYLKDPTIKWLTKYGTDWPCQGDNPPNGHPPGLKAGEETSWIYYDAGAYAMAFAVVKANENHQNDGGRTFVDLWNGEGKKGFWHSIGSYEIDSMNGWPSMVPEGSGWKKALAEFTGYTTVTDFYAAFEAHVVVNGQVKSEIELLNFLNTGSLTNAEVAKLNLSKASFKIFEKRKAPPEVCELSFANKRKLQPTIYIVTATMFLFCFS
eukprot:g3534.t1